MKLPRMWEWIVVNVLAVAAVEVFAHAQLPVLLYKVVLVTLSANLAYMIDRSLYTRLTDRLDATMARDNVAVARIIARSLIFIGVVLGLSLGI